MRMARRLGLVGKGKYVWDVYNVVWGANETTTPYTGNFTLSSSSRYKMVSSSYAATSSQFTLTNAVQTTRANIKVGDYLVNVSTSNSTVTTGSYLYKITSISGNTFYYTRWSPTQVRGATAINQVSSSTFDYPENGIQGGYWYVLVSSGSSSGSTDPKYSWERYEVSAMANELDRAVTSMSVPDSISSYRYAVSPIDAEIIYTTSGYVWKLNNPSYVRADLLDMMVSVDSTMSSGTYANTQGPYLYQFLVDDTTAISTQVILYTVIRYGIQVSKGAYIDTVTSNTNDYPSNGEHNGYWYVLVS